MTKIERYCATGGVEGDRRQDMVDFSPFMLCNVVDSDTLEV